MNQFNLADLGLVIPIIGLAGVSLSIIGSTTPSLLVTQLIFFLSGIILYLFFSSADYRILTRFAWLFYVFSIVFLFLSFLGKEVRGSYRWIDIGWLHLQPSELIKPFVTITIVSYLMRSNKFSLKFFSKSFLLYIPFIVLIFKQPDLGNVIVYLFTFVSIWVMNGLSIAFIISGIIISVLFLPGFWLILKDYQKSRIFAFINPQSDPVGAGYNSIQALIAIGSGQLLGLGLGKGTQSHLLFLPEYHTDFVFASLGEELGFLGGVLVLFFYLILLSYILKVTVNAEDNFGKLLCIGIFAQVFIQVFINIGMNLGILPITGITLPLLSYGGSSIISTMINLGLVASVARQERSKSTIVIR